MIDVAAGLATYLGEAWGEAVEVSGLSTTTAGARRHNVIFDARIGDADAHRLVATIVPAGETMINEIDAEAGVRLLAEAGGVLAPHVHLWRTDGELVGGPFMVSDFVAGETVPRRVLRLVEETGNGDLVASQLGESLARLHAIDPADVTVPLRELDPKDPTRAALVVLNEAVDLLPQRRPALELGLRWLERNLPPPPQRVSILHTDVRNGNIIVGEDGLRAVLDWEGALAAGDPMQDLAWPSLRMWRFRVDEREIGGFSDRAPYVEGYERAGGTYDEERFEWWKVFETARWAVGLAVQTMAFLDGSVPSIVMAASGRRVPELEWDLLMLIRER